MLDVGRSMHNMGIFCCAVWRAVAADDRARILACAAAIWLVYVAAVEYIATAAARGRRPDIVSPSRDHLLHGFLNSLDDAPPLARWDSIWYYGIAKEGYAGAGHQNCQLPAFFPLYPLLMRWCGNLFATDYLTAGLWISRLSLLSAMLLLSSYALQTQRGARTAAFAPIALVAFPSAFLLVAVYSESLFLALALGAFRLADKRRFCGAAALTCAASLTRIHGLALIAALVVLGWRQRRDRPHCVLLCFFPAAAGIAVYLALAYYCAAEFGDPLHHFAIKRKFWGQGEAAPWSALAKAVEAAFCAARAGRLADIYTLLQIPCAYLLVLTIVVLSREDGRHCSPELTYVGCSLLMSLFGGALGGMPRFALVAFPVFAVLAKLERWPLLWSSYLLVGALLQACLILHYVSFVGPAP